MRRSTFLLLATLILLGGTWLRLAELSRYPPGLHYDEAADMLLGRDIAWFGYRPFPVVTAYSGREALFYYLSVPLLRIFGTNVMATRLTSAFLGLLTIAATVALGRALLRGQAAAPVIALAAGAWLAVNGPQVWLTRQGFRTSPQPLLEALCLWLLFVALNRRQRWMIPAILGGISGGLALYVYMAARVFPPWLLLPLALLVTLDRRARGWRLRQVAVFLAALAVTALPIALFYLRHPDIFLDRLAQVAPTGQTVTLLESLRLHLEMFFIRGDPLLRYNLYPGRPLFDSLSGILMLAGLAGAAWLLLFAARRTALQRAAAALLLLCPLLIAPSVIAVGGLPPSHMRSVAMVPLIFFLPALGAVGIVHLGRRRAGYMLLAGLLGALGLNTWSDYRAWGARADLFYDSDGDLMLAARWLEQQAGPDELMYIAAPYYEHPTVLAHNLDHGRIRWMMADQLWLPPPDRSAIYVFPRSVKRETFPAWLPGHEIAAERGPDGAPAYAVFRLEPESRPGLQPGSGADANLAGILRLHGADISAATAGDAAQGTLYWEVLRAPDRDDLAPLIVLEDAWGNEISRAMPYFEHTDRWLPGEWLLLQYRLPIPTGTPPGTYAIRAAWVGKKAQDDYLPLHDAGGRFAGIWASVGDLSVQRGAPVAAGLPGGLDPIRPGLYALETPTLLTQVEQGDVLRFTVRWYAQDTPGEAGPLRLVAEREADARLWALWEGHPVYGTYPMSRWQAGEQVIDRYEVPIPPDFPPGRYTIRLLLGGAPVFSQPVEVLSVERQFTMPPLAHVVDLTFGDRIALRGYELERSGSGEITIRLAWQARQAPDRDYTVFVHVVGPDGAIFSQQDRQPARPTRRWIAGEVIADAHTLPIPPGEYRLKIGLYVQENGLRLLIRDAAGRAQGDALELAGVP